MQYRTVLVAVFTVSLALVAWGTPTAPEVTIVENNPGRTVFEVAVQDLGISPVNLDGQSFSELSFPGEVFAVLEEGKPQVPKVSVLLAIPTGARVSARAEVLETRKLRVERVAPLQPPLLEGQKPGPLVIDNNFYGQDVSYPGYPVKLIETGVWRDLDVANIQVYPVQVNPARGEVELASKVRVEVHYSGGMYPRTVADWMVPLYGEFIDNFSSLRIRPETDYTDGIRYLVFCNATHSTNPWLDSLLLWVEKRGYDVHRIVKPSFTAQEIKDSIRAEYNLHLPHLLQYVLLVGEYAEIPMGSYSGVGMSDYWYSDLEPWPSGDNYPEIGVARLSPNSPLDLEQQVRKILAYQKNPATTNDWLARLTMVAHREQYPAKYSGCVRGIYNMPKPYWNPTLDTIMGQFQVNAAVTSAVNAGVGILPYRGHGDDYEWWEWGVGNVSFYNSDIYALSNGDLTPVVYNIACNNGRINDTTCFSEAWMRKFPGGAAASLAATQASYTYPNHGICSTLVRATCDTWTITVPGVRDYAGPIFNITRIEMYMDAYVAKYWPASPYPYNIWMYLFLGDPSMPVWAGGMPVVAEVDYPDSIPLGPYNLNVTVRAGGQPVEDALVCAWKDSDFYVAERTGPGGVATLDVNALSGGEVLVTVSEGHANHSTPGVAHTPILPHEGSTMAGGGGTPQPRVVYVSNQVDDPPPGGNNNHQFDPGETGTIIVTLRNTGNTEAQNVNAWLKSTHAQFVIIDSTSAYGTIPQDSTRNNSADRFAAQALAAIPPGTMVTCTLRVTSDNWQHEWLYTFTLRIGQPPQPPGTVLWGPKVCPGMPTDWGLYGVAHNANDNNIYCVYFMRPMIYKYTSDSSLTAQGTIPAPEDSCTDIDFCDYDGNFWVVANASKKVYKITPTGSVIRSFDVSFIHYPVGIAECDDEHKLYISDRRDLGIQPQRIFVTDTLGNVLDTIIHPLTGNYGTRCLAFEWPLPVEEVPYLLNMYTWFNTAGTAIDSCCMYEMDRVTGAILNGYRFPNADWNMRGIEYDRRDGSYWVTIMQWSLNPSNQILKVVGFHPVGIAEERPVIQSRDGPVSLQARPNPFNLRTTITAAANVAGPVSVRVFDNTGRLVRTWESDLALPGRVEFTWEGTDNAGRALAPGIYFYRLNASGSEAWGKVVLSR